MPQFANRRMLFIQRFIYVLTSCSLALLALGALLHAVAVQAATRDVCPTCTYTTLQAAIGAAGPNDTIRVAAGTYSESLDITQSLALRGGYSGPPGWAFNPSIYTTTVRGNNAQSVIAITGPVSVTLDSLTIENGRGVPTGGGIRSISATLTLQNSIIANNGTTGTLTLHKAFGAGAYIQGGAAIIVGNSFLGNTDNCPDHNCVTNGGGGLYLSGTVTATVTNNRFVSNYSWTGAGLGTYNAPFYAADNLFQNNTGAYGTGLYIEGQGLAIIEHNVLTGNHANDRGTITYNSQATDGIILSRNVVSGNEAYRTSGLIFADSAAPLTMTNNLVANNLSDIADFDSNAVELAASQSWLSNNTFASNLGPGDTVAAILVIGNNNQLTNNIFFNHTTAVSVTTGADVTISFTAFYSNGLNWAGDGSILTGSGILTATDPKFFDPAGNFHLRPESLLIGVGTSLGAPATDLEGHLRPSSRGFTVGAYEFVNGLLLFLPVIRR